MVNQQIFLPMIPDSAPIVINISQYDYDAPGYAGRLFFNLISNGTAYDLNGATAIFQGEKPDGTAFAYSGTVVSGSVVRVNVRQQMTNVAGRVVCNLLLINSEGQIGSFNVWLEVQESATAGSTPSQTDIPALVAQAKEYADSAQESAELAESYTGHPAYIGANNNWYVYDTITEQYVDSGVSALGEGIASITKIDSTGLIDTYKITYTSGEYTTFQITNGSAPSITMTAEADNLSSDNPTVNVNQGGTLTNPTFEFSFSGLKGAPGAQGVPGQPGPAGNGIASVSKIGTQGLVDTYRIVFTDQTYYDFTVTNGQNGTGAGDMIQSDYDPQQAVFNAGGIPAYVASVIPTAITVIDNLNSTSSTAALSANQGHELNNPTITEASTRTNIQTGDTLTVIFGKIKKFFTDLKAVAFSGSFNDLSDQPTIPAAANNGQLNISQNNTLKASFYADQAGNSSANIKTGHYHGSPTASIVSNGEISFSGIDDTGTVPGKIYKPVFVITANSTNKNPYARIKTISGDGTSSMAVTYETDADAGTSAYLWIDEC